MEDYRSRQLNMLAELDALCRANNIPYILSGETARMAWLKGVLPQNETFPTVAMLYSDARRLEKISLAAGRRMDSAITNRRIPRMIQRYSDEKTTCLRVDERNCFRWPGLGVDIELIRPVPKRGVVNKLWKALEAIVSLMASFRSHTTPWRVLLALPAVLERPLLRLVYSGGLGGRSDRLRIARFPRKSVEFSSKFLAERMEVAVGEKRFFVPKNIEAYLLTEFDSIEGKNQAPSPMDELALTVIDTDMNCAQAQALVKRLWGKNTNHGWIRQFVLRGKMRSLRKKIEGYWNLLSLTQDRFRLWKLLMPRKNAICKLYEQGDLPAVRGTMEPYFAALERHAAKGLSLCFDEDLFSVALAILEAEGKSAMANQLRSRVFPEHLKPIQIEGWKYD